MDLNFNPESLELRFIENEHQKNILELFIDIAKNSFHSSIGEFALAFTLVAFAISVVYFLLYLRPSIRQKEYHKKEPLFDKKSTIFFSVFPFALYTIIITVGVFISTAYHLTDTEGQYESKQEVKVDKIYTNGNGNIDDDDKTVIFKSNNVDFMMYKYGVSADKAKQLKKNQSYKIQTKNTFYQNNIPKTVKLKDDLDIVKVTNDAIIISDSVQDKDNKDIKDNTGDKNIHYDVIYNR